MLLWVATKGADEIDKKGILHRLWCQAWVFTKMLCDNRSKMGKDLSQFVDQRREDIYGVAELGIIPPAEE
jgi:hypothetical protein